jgi:hypothetical protein
MWRRHPLQGVAYSLILIRDTLVLFPRPEREQLLNLGKFFRTRKRNC